MKWIAISGSWRSVTSDIEAAVRDTVRTIIAEGNGIVCGGAAHVDHIAIDEALVCDPSGRSIQVFIPCTPHTYLDYYTQEVHEGVVEQYEATTLLVALHNLKAVHPTSLHEGTATVLHPQDFFDTNTQIIAEADELIAFHVNNSKGTQDAIDKAHAKHIPVTVFSYTIDINHIST